MNKKALLGKIIIGLIIVLVISFFLARYVVLDKGNLELTTGEVTITIDYNNTEDNTISPPTPPTPKTNQTNQTQQLLNNSQE